MDHTVRTPPSLAKARESSPDPLRLRALRILKGTANFDDRYVADQADLVRLVEILSSLGCTIAFTMGSWDFFHLGHSDYIKKGKEEAAKICPDAEHIIMVVGVDSDDLVRQRKGAKRPFVKEGERLRQLAHLRSVDILALEQTLGEMPRVLPHDVRIVSESTNDSVRLERQRQYCRHLINLPPQLDDSATARLRRLTLEGSTETLEEIEVGLKELLEKIRAKK